MAISQSIIKAAKGSVRESIVRTWGQTSNFDKLMREVMERDEKRNFGIYT